MRFLTFNFLNFHRLQPSLDSSRADLKYAGNPFNAFPSCFNSIILSARLLFKNLSFP